MVTSTTQQTSNRPRRPFCGLVLLLVSLFGFHRMRCSLSFPSKQCFLAMLRNSRKHTHTHTHTYNSGKVGNCSPFTRKRSTSGSDYELCQKLRFSRFFWKNPTCSVKLNSFSNLFVFVAHFWVEEVLWFLFYIFGAKF